MNPRIETVLCRLLWLSEVLMRPTLRKVDEGFMFWEGPSGLPRQVRRMQAQGLVEEKRKATNKRRLYRLTEAGRLAVLGGRDPETAWTTPWDRKWRLFLFDVPETERSLRRRLTRGLRALGCGCLQGSVWIAATRSAAIHDVFPEDGADCSHLMILEAESKGVEVDRKMVDAAWDFGAINRAYQKHLEALNRFSRISKSHSAAALVGWAKQENAAWLHAAKNDPMLPDELLPRGYLGKQAWQTRRKLFKETARLVKQVIDEPQAPR